MTKSTCEEYDCRWNSEGEHTHVGDQTYLRRVVDSYGKLILRDESPKEETSGGEERSTDSIGVSG